MAEIQVTFRLIGGLFSAVLPINADGTHREIDQVHYFGAKDVASATGVIEESVNEVYSSFLYEVGSGLQGAERSATACRILRDRFGHLSDEHFDEFMMVCRQRDINPWGNQMWATVQWNTKRDREELVIQLTADGFHAMAIRSGELERIIGPQWCGDDGVWCEAWLRETPPLAARVGVQRRGMSEPLYMSAPWRDYASFTLKGREKVYQGFWDKMPAFMLGKCAACLAIRRVFAEKLDGIYSVEEMQQSKNPRLAPGEPADFKRVPVEDLPATSRQFQLRLIDYGFQDPERRQKLIDRMREAFPLLFARNMPAFYERVLTELRERPETYGAARPIESEVERRVEFA